MKTMTFFLILFFTSLFTAQAEVCSATSSINMPASTPTARFEFTPDDLIVMDKKTGLTWARCQWGHDWNPGTSSCVKNSSDTVTWKQALIAVKDANTEYYGKTGWRLPNIKELSSIVEYKCFEPAINNEVFPGTRSGSFWSNTYVTIAGNNGIRVLIFGTGEMSTVAEDEQSYLRLVKDTPPQTNQ